MPAPKQARPIREENPAWIKAPQPISCECGWRGPVADMLGVKGPNNTLWCPECKSMWDWLFD